jgi:hypothetical protein
VVEGMEPIQRARVGEDCNSIPPILALFAAALGAPGEVGTGLTGVPLAGATGALSALPNPMRTV